MSIVHFLNPLFDLPPMIPFMLFVAAVMLIDKFFVNIGKSINRGKK